MRKVLIKDDLDEPRAIALNPVGGWMFWTDWGNNPKIERAGMDGSHRQAIISDNLKWPNGLTLDLVKNLVYWVDAKLNTISSCDYKGTNRRVILFLPDSLRHPFSITTFEDWVYWTDWDKAAIFKANKFTGKDVQNVTGTLKIDTPMAIHVYHPYRQTDGENHCQAVNGHCSHLCLPAPQINSHSPRVSCACPDGLQMLPDRLTCVRHTENITSSYSVTHSNSTVQIHNQTDVPNTKTTSSCTTPNGKQGYCISVLMCKALKAASLSTLREFACGELGSFMVCCSTLENSTENQSSTEVPKGITRNISEDSKKKEAAPKLSDRQYALNDLLSDVLHQTCGVEHNDDLDFNETLTSGYEFPWLVYIPLPDYSPDFHLTRRGKNCVGVLISQRYVLTDIECNGTSVIFGLHSIDQDVSCITGQNLTASPNCTRPLIVEKIDKILPIPDSRIVLVRLETPITYSDHIRAVCLPIDVSNAQPQENETVLTSGWSAHQYADGGTGMIKKRVSHSLMKNKDCKYGNTSFVCGITPPDSSDFVCSNDNGGPLMYQYRTTKSKRSWTVLGIITGKVDCDKHQPVVAERITPNILNWILDHIER